MFKFFLKMCVKTGVFFILLLLLLTTLLYFCTQSYFICHVVFPVASYFNWGYVTAQRVELLPFEGKLSILKGHYLSKDCSLEIRVDSAQVTCDFSSFFSDTPSFKTVQIVTPHIVFHPKKSQNSKPLNFDFFTIPNIVVDSLNVANGRLTVFPFELKDLTFELKDFRRGKDFTTQFKALLNDQYKLDFSNQISVDPVGHIFAGRYDLTLLYKQGVFENKGEIKKTTDGLFFDSESACLLSLDALGQKGVIGKSHQRLHYDASTERIVVEKFEGELALGEQNLIHLHADTALCFDLKTSKFIHDNELDLVTLEFKKTPLPVLNHLLNMFEVDSDFLFIDGEICGTLSLRFTDKGRFVLEGPLAFEHCQNQSQTLYNIKDGTLSFSLYSWFDFQGRAQIGVKDLQFKNFGKVDGFTGEALATLDIVQKTIDFNFDLDAKIFPLLYDFYPPLDSALKNTFLGKNEFLQTDLKAKSEVRYAYLEGEVLSFKSVFNLNTHGDSLLKIQMQSTDTVHVYDFDLISYPSIHHPALKSVSIPQDYQNNCARLLEERYIHLQNRWLLNFDSNFYELQSGKINFYPEKDTRRQDVYITVDSKMTIDSRGISPLFFSLQGHAPALDCSGMIPSDAEAARIFCNYFFTDLDIVNFDGHFEYYFHNNLLLMYNIYFEYPKQQDGSYFKISLDTPLENLCGTDTPATDIVIRANAMTRASNFNPALKVVEPFKLIDGFITFDNLFTFSFIDDYFAIDGENNGIHVAFTNGETVSNSFDFTHEMDVYLTDTHLLLNAQKLKIFTDSNLHLDAQYKVKLNRLNNKVNAFANWSYLDEWVVNEFDELYLHKLQSLQSLKSQGFSEINLNENGVLDHLLCDLICDSMIIANNAQKPLTLMTKFNYAYSDSHFTLDSCYLLAQTGDSRQDLVHLIGRCSNSKDSTLLFDLHSKYIHLPTLIAFLEDAKSLDQTNDTSVKNFDSFHLPDLYFDADVRLDSVIVTDEFTLRIKSQIHATPTVLKIENTHVLSGENELSFSGEVECDSHGLLHQKLRGRSKRLNLYNLAYFFTHYTDKKMEGDLTNVEFDLYSHGNAPQAILCNVTGDVRTDLVHVAIPLETESMVLKIATLPLYICAQMNQLSLPRIHKIDRASLTDPFVKIATFKEGAVYLQFIDGHIYLKTFSLREGREIYDFKLRGSILLQDGQLEDCVAIIKPIPISIFAFQVKNTIFDPEVSILNTMSNTVLEGVRFYANPFELGSGVGAFGRGLIPVYVAEKMDVVKFWKSDSDRLDESKKIRMEKKSDSKMRFWRLFNLF